jgi:hypothetical protein
MNKADSIPAIGVRFSFAQEISRDTTTFKVRPSTWTAVANTSKGISCRPILRKSPGTLSRSADVVLPERRVVSGNHGHSPGPSRHRPLTYLATDSPTQAILSGRRVPANCGRGLSSSRENHSRCCARVHLESTTIIWNNSRVGSSLKMVLTKNSRKR